MRHFPAFFDLAGRTVLVAGTTPAADQRAGLLRAAGAIVRRRNSPTDADFADARLAFIATGEELVDARLAAAARAQGVPVNVVDRPHLCDFVVPAIVDREDVVVGISTGGGSPTLARHLRTRIESVLPSRLGALARFAASFRDRVRATVVDGPERRRFWDRMIRGPIADRVLAGDEQGAQDALIAALDAARSGAASGGSIALVGAGPGAADLLTLRALQALQEADVILHDALASADVLAYARREATIIDVGKRQGSHRLSQDDINALMVMHARAGSRVVRLKGGDPFIFGRGGEELAFARRHGIPVQVVPGVTAALGCAASAGIPLTHRDLAPAVTFVTGHRRPGSPAPDWRALAASGSTIVVYMGVTVAAEMRRQLIAAGLPRSTPVAIIENGTLEDQRVSRGTLDLLGLLAARHRDDGPALIVIGDVSAAAQSDNLPLIARAS